MSDRIKGFTVVLDKDYRDDDAHVIATAIGMLKGVSTVIPSVSNPNDFMNRERVKNELRGKIIDILFEK